MVDRGVHGSFASWSRRGVLLVGAGLLAGCGAAGDLVEDRSQLPVLLEDPMAAKDLLGLSLKEEFESEYRRPLANCNASVRHIPESCKEICNRGLSAT